jgi:hypothetical protein
VVDADISGYFDTVENAQRRRFLDLRVADGVGRGMIAKSLAACLRAA